ncbi:MAG: hypothetical protein MR710_01405 [Bacteroidales bacterium]|nr:hypothetical protein [Bacteroidales bacterium]
MNEKEEKRAFSDLFSPFFRPKQMTRTNRGTFSRAKKAASDRSLSTKKAARWFSGSIGKEGKWTERRVWTDSESKEKNDASEK